MDYSEFITEFRSIIKAEIELKNIALKDDDASYVDTYYLLGKREEAQYLLTLFECILANHDTGYDQ